MARKDPSIRLRRPQYDLARKSDSFASLVMTDPSRISPGG